MKTLQEFIDIESSEILNHIKIEFNRSPFINETKGIFNGCEDIAEWILKEILRKIANQENLGEFIFKPKKKIYKWFDSIKIHYEKDKKYENNSAETVFDLKNDDINITNNKFELKLFIKSKIDKYDIRGYIMHELTHMYFISKLTKEKYSNIKNSLGYFKYSNYKNADQSIFYCTDFDEVKAFVTQFQSDILKEKPKSANEAFIFLKKNDQFIIYENLYKIVIKNQLKEVFPNICKEYRKCVKDDENLEDYKIISKINSKIIKAWKYIIKTIPRMCADTLQKPFNEVASRSFVKELNEVMKQKIELFI